ncbi:MAG: LytTR family transcriptional regulator [Bacteroidales bacterium]|nr:LytTR family transcriptional regulator [Bacteroidales bacterium]
MKILGRIAFWIAALALVAALLVSLDFTLPEALLVSLIFGPGAVALEYLMPKARKPMDKVYLALAVLVANIVLILFLHGLQWDALRRAGKFPQIIEVPPMLINPIFLALILTALAIGDFYWAKWLRKRFKQKDRTITFFSDRRSVTLRVADIDYVESNDTEVRVVTTDGTAYRNKTGISQWENLLGEDFLRIHRSYLVNIARSRLSSPEEVITGQRTLPVSRKYRESALNALRPEAEAE